MNKSTLMLLFIFIIKSALLWGQEPAKPEQISEEAKTGAPISNPTNDTQTLSHPTDNVKSEQENKSKSDVLGEKEEKPTKENIFEYTSYNSFGINLSSHSGLGLSYRYHLMAPILFQITGGVISEGESYFYAIGLEIQRELSKSKDKRAFGAFATGIYGTREKEVYDLGYSTGMNPPERWVSKNIYSFAIGVGGELAFGNSIVDSLTIGCEIYPIGVYLDENEDNWFNMFPGAAVYLFYNF